MSARDDTLLELIGDLHCLLTVDDLVDAMLAALHRHVPSEYVSINDIGPAARAAVAVIAPPQPAHLHEVYGQLALENPLTVRYLETQDGRPYRFSDVCSREELHATELYRRLYSPLGVEYQIAFTLPAPSGRILGIALSRADSDYSAEEKELLARARPFLIQSWQTALECSALRDALEHSISAAAKAAVIEALCARGATARQAEVLMLIAQGRSQRQAAEALALSERTVHKHLERCYRALGVSNRFDASELVWTLVDEATGGTPRRGLVRPAE